MSEIKTLKNHAFRWLTGALASVMFVVLLGGYRWHIRTTDAKLSERSAPMQELTQRLLSSSGSDDSLLGSSIAAKEALISGLQLTPSVDAELRRYISSIYSAAGAYDNAKASLPQTNDWTYLFQRGTIDLLQSNSFLSGDVLGLYSGRQTIQSAIAYLSGAAMSTSNTEKKRMSEHNLSVALASQIGIEITLCTTSYSALASGWSDILETTSGLLASYQRQQGILNTLKTNDPKTAQCLAAYKNELLTNSAELTKRLPVFEKLSALAAAKNNAYAKSPLQCPLGIDLYDDIVTVRWYRADFRALLLTNSTLENTLLTGTVNDIAKACESSQNSSTNTWSLQELLKPLDEWTQSSSQNTSTWYINGSGYYEDLPEDTMKIINDIYQKNMDYIQSMQQAQQDKTYRPLRFLDKLFQEFYGDSSEFTK